MPNSSFASTPGAVPSLEAASSGVAVSPVALSERSLVLLALVRIFLGFLWFQQGRARSPLRLRMGRKHRRVCLILHQPYDILFLDEATTDRQTKTDRDA